MWEVLYYSFINIPEVFKNISGLILVSNFIYMTIYELGEIIFILYLYNAWKGTVDWFLLILLVIIYFIHINLTIILIQKTVEIFTEKKLTDNNGI